MTRRAKLAHAIWCHSNGQPDPRKFFADRTRGLRTQGAQHLKDSTIKIAFEGAETQNCCLPFWSWRGVLLAGLRPSRAPALCAVVLPIQPIWLAWSFPPNPLTKHAQALPFWISSLRVPVSNSSNQSFSLTSTLSASYPYLSMLYVIFLLLFLVSHWKLPVPIAVNLSLLLIWGEL